MLDHIWTMFDCWTSFQLHDCFIRILGQLIDTLSTTVKMNHIKQESK